MKSSSSAPLSLPDFERIFRTIHGVLLNERCDPSSSCLFFGVIGAAILQKHHDLPANTVVGAAGYNFGRSADDVLVFAEPPPSSPQSTTNAFHCWTEVNGWAVDFQSPLFSERGFQVDLSLPVPRYMLQKPLQDASESMWGLGTPKAYWYERNQLLETQLLAGFYSRPAYVDLLKICVDWYQPHPKQMTECIGIGNQHNEVTPVRQSHIKLNGAW